MWDGSSYDPSHIYGEAMRIIALSDLHGKWRSITSLPEGDVLVLAGDILSNYSDFKQSDAVLQCQELPLFDEWIKQFNFKHKLVIAGNHDWMFHLIPAKALKIENFTYLQDSAVIIDGVKFYGYPWVPEFCGWAFMHPRRGKKLKATIDIIDRNTNVLISHGPPHGILDSSPITNGPVGCELLRDKVLSLPELKACVFGHVHGGNGSVVINFTKFENVSYVSEKYEPINKPRIIDL